MRWQLFLGASLLTAAVLLPHAPLRSIVGGIGLAALVQVAWHRLNMARHDQGHDRPNR